MRREFKGPQLIFCTKGVFLSSDLRHGRKLALLTFFSASLTLTSYIERERERGGERKRVCQNVTLVETTYHLEGNRSVIDWDYGPFSY